MSVLNIGQEAGEGVIDTEDAILAPIFVIAGVAMSGGTIQWLGYDLNSIAYEFSGYSLTYAFILAVVALGVAWFSNQPEISKMEEEYTYLTIGMIVLLFAQEFVPTVSDFIAGSTIAQLAVVLVYAGGFYAVSYLG